MPMVDAYIPEGALSSEAEDELMAKLTDIVLRNEGVDPASEAGQAISWAFLHRPTTLYVAGERVTEPRYRIVASVPEGQFDDERRRNLVSEATEAVLDAEEGRYKRNPLRVWVLAYEIPDGTWGAAGRIFRLPEIVGFVLGDGEKGREYAEQRFAARRGLAVPA